MSVATISQPNHNLVLKPVFERIKLMVLNAKEYYEKKGLLFLFKLLIVKAGFVRFSRSLKIIRMDLDKFEASFEPPIFRQATIDDIINDKQFNIEFFTKQKSIYRLRTLGHRLFIVKDKNKIVFAIWVDSNKNASFWWLDNLPLHLPEDMVYISGIFTSPDFRAKGLFSTVTNQLYSSLKKEGIKTLIGTIHPENTLSLKIHLQKKPGWEEYQTITYERFWHIRRYTVTKPDSSVHKTSITMFKAPKNIWRWYL